ncbi:MAG: PDZ domain-containing protein [Opitutaceae bacterium]
MMPKKWLRIAVPVLLCAARLRGETEPKLLLQEPSLSKTQIAFSFGGDIWIVGRSGGDAHRLAGSSGTSGGPVFSPDGGKVAYTSQVDGNTDVYVVDASGGVPVRLTYHPASDIAVGWTPDGSRVLFASDRSTPRDLPQLYTVKLTGGLPQELPLPSGTRASYSPDGTHLAYVPISQWEPDWKMYRGGQTTPIWIADLADSSVVKVPRENSNDRDPMWVGNTVYFLSDRDGRFTLFAYDTKTMKVRKLLANDGFDIKTASAGPGGIVYSQFGSLHVYEFDSGTSHPVAVHIASDLPRLRPHFEKIKPERILAAALSPTGKRAVFEAYGEILSVPAEKGDIRNLTQSPGVADRDPSWSPDGRWIAYFSDESGEYALHVRSQDGLTPPRKIDLGKPGSFFYGPTWSPDSTKIAYTDKRLKLWYVAVDGGTPVAVDADLNAVWGNELNPSWSPDGQWIVYTKRLLSNFHAVYIYSLADRSIHPVTDGMSDAGYPRFDHNGKYLYFTANTQKALSGSWIDMSGFNHPSAANVYAAVLRKDLPSPVAPESDEEEAPKDADAAAKDKDAAKPAGPASAAATPAAPATAANGPADKKPATDKDAPTGGAKVAADAAKEPEKPKIEPVKIDFDGIDQRIVAMPLPAGNYVDLQTGKDGILYFAIAPMVPDPGSHDGGTASISKFDLKTRKTDPIVSGVSAFMLSSNGEKMLFSRDNKWFIQDADKASEPGKGALETDNLEVYVDPRAAWRQMYHEAWRIERDFFYDPGFHGLDIAAAERLYASYLPGIASRSDLNVLFREMTGWLVVGHMYVWGGDQPEMEHVSVGLLGADFAVDNGLYRIARIYKGENWNPELQAPLTRPGVKVSEGDYLFAVNGRELKGGDEVYARFQETAGKQTTIRVGSKPDGSDAHNETVVPIDSESNLRYRAWIDGNRRKVDELSNGRLAYVHIPDTGGDGYNNFNRYYFANVGKQGAILDERFNHGGSIADYIVDELNKPVRMLVARREGGEDLPEPDEAIQGPKVMLINEMSGSGGDALPWMFHTSKAGTLVGKRTWGGLVGIGGFPQLMDGGTIMAPKAALYGIRGEWEVENHGIAPDIEVDMDPKLVREGHDPQLEKAVEVALEQLAKNPPPKYPRPPYPNYHQKLPADPALP